MERINAIAVFQGKIKGYVQFSEIESGCKITVNVSNIKDGLHGFHIHEAGNLLIKDCKGCKGHFNPYNKNHGDISDKERHVGDLGNIKVKNGKCQMVIYDKMIKLRGKYSVLGRSVVIHAKEDDLGLGGNKESLITGNAGARLDCAVIGYI